jgi:Carboxypeptidase regulatory-like domain
VGRVGSDPEWTSFTAHWDGASWTQTPSATSGEFLAVSPDGAGGLWAVGDEQATTYFGTSTLVEHLCATSASTAPTGTSAAPAVQRASTTQQASTSPVRRLCSAPAKTGYAGCFALVRTPASRTHGASPQAAPDGYGPADLQAAYRLPSDTNRSGQTVAIVDAFDDPTADADLATYRAQYGLPPCTAGNGCLRKVDQRGGTSYPPPDAGWAAEISLDLDMVSAACPDCRILLVEADDNSIGNLGAAVNEAVALGAKFVSNSYGGPEDAAETTWDASYFYHPGVAITASSGDFGYGVEYPAASQYVTAVGGTSLVRDGSGRGWAESAWPGAGSGCSVFVTKPSWHRRRLLAPQRGRRRRGRRPRHRSRRLRHVQRARLAGLRRDQRLLADPRRHVRTRRYAGRLEPAQLLPLRDATAFNDVTAGDNGTCTPTYLCTAGPGYDGPTGLGTPSGIAGFAANGPHGPHGDIVGTATDQATNAPLVNAKVSAGDQITYTDTAGHYDLFAPTGRYTVTAAQYGYQAESIRRVTVTQDQATTEDFVLTAQPTHTVSGTVTDGSGHGWPLYAQITIDGMPGGPIWSDPATGHYTVTSPPVALTPCTYPPATPDTRRRASRSPSPRPTSSPTSACP